MTMPKNLQIQQLAYKIWLEKGSPVQNHNPNDDWDDAEKILAQKPKKERKERKAKKNKIQEQKQAA